MVPRVIHVQRPIDRLAEVRLQGLAGRDFNQTTEDLKSWVAITERTTGIFLDTNLGKAVDFRLQRRSMGQLV